MGSDDRLEEILGHWQDARESGDSIDPEELIREHPDLAKALRVRFAALDLVDMALARTAALPEGTPRKIGDFKILREINRGGMGVVYEAQQLSMRRRVALKVLSNAITATPHAIKRFQREARAAGRLHHTNIVPVYGMGQCAGYWYYAMELVAGRPLSAVVAELKARRPTEVSLAGTARDQPAPPSDPHLGSGTGDRSYHVRVAGMFVGVADALDLAHQEGIVHRDIKPANLLLDTDGTLKVVDFGLARTEQDGSPMTISGDLLGTPVYMSPEQTMAKRVAIDHRTDIYSLGATLYEVATLRPPFGGATVHDVCSQITSKDPVRPRRANHHVPKDLETIVLKAMDKERDKRYQSAGELARDLLRFAEGAVIHARRIGPVGRVWRGIKRNKTRVALATTIVLLVIAGAVAARSAVRSTAQLQRRNYARLLAEADLLLAQAPPMGAHVAIGARAEARRLLKRAIEMDPDRPEAYLSLALAANSSKKCLAGIDEARSFGLAPRTYHLARAYAFQRAREVGQAEVERRLAKDDEGREAPIDWYFEARLLAQRGEKLEARRFLGRVIDSPHSPTAVSFLALRQRAALRRRAGDLAGAIADLHRLQGSGGTNMFLHIRIASLWRALGDEAEAEQNFGGALDMARRDVSAADWTSLCRMCRLAREHDWLDRATQEALALHPDETDLLVLTAQRMVEVGKLGRARDLADRAVASAPQDHFAQETRGQVLCRLEQYPAAVEAYERALQSRKCFRSLHGLGLALSHVERYEEALDALGPALQRNPRSVKALRLQAVASYECELYEEALQSLEKIGARDEGSAGDSFLLAMTHWRLDEQDEAREWYDKAVASIDERTLPDEEVARVRAEAEEVLGIEKE